MLKISGDGSSAQIFRFFIMNFFISTSLSVFNIQDKNRYIQWKVDCPRNCTCKVEEFQKYKGHINKTVDCRNAIFPDSKIPDNIPKDVEILVLPHCRLRVLNFKSSLQELHYLDVSSNSLNKMDRQLRKFTKLCRLDMHNNSIRQLQNGAFSGLKDLEYMDLSFNRIRTIEPHAFGGLNYLKKLHLEGNKIMSLNTQWFISMPSLGWLYLSNNDIGRIKRNIFENLPFLFTLKLDRNRITKIENGGFHGLKGLRILELSANRLRTIPVKELAILPKLQYLYFDKNPIVRISKYAFNTLNLTMLTISYMPELLIVEKEAFSNLFNLVTLQLHDNNKLLYLDPEAFLNCPKLKNLYVHNNKLKSVSSLIKSRLPTLSSIHLYNNPILCDCNAMWIKQEILRKETIRNYTSVLFDDNILKCGSPRNKYGMLIKNLPILALNFSCAPVVISLFRNDYNLSIGEELRLECHSLGLPSPNISWRIPNGTILENKNVSVGRFEIHDSSIFIVKYLRESDSGVYSCQSSSTEGFDIRSTRVVVNNKPIRIRSDKISGNYITISWNGTHRLWSMTGFQIHYMQVGSSKTYVIPLDRGILKYRYTFTNLKPITTYNFCIVYVFETEYYTVHCKNITTTEEIQLNSGITRINSKIVIGVVTSVFMLLIFGCGFIVARKFGKRKDYFDPVLKENVSLMDIPLDSMCHSSNVPADCTSRTSLIQSQD